MGKKTLERRETVLRFENLHDISNKIDKTLDVFYVKGKDGKFSNRMLLEVVTTLMELNKAERRWDPKLHYLENVGTIEELLAAYTVQCMVLVKNASDGVIEEIHEKFIQTEIYEDGFLASYKTPPVQGDGGSYPKERWVTRLVLDAVETKDIFSKSEGAQWLFETLISVLFMADDYSIGIWDYINKFLDFHMNEDVKYTYKAEAVNIF